MLVAHNLAIGLKSIDGFELDINRPYTFCRICGKVYQTDYDRKPHLFTTLMRTIVNVGEEAKQLRQNWSHNHANMHTEAEHRSLAMSGFFLTPEASIALAPIGVIDLTALVLSDDHAAAYMEAPRAPREDCEGG